MKNEKKIKDSIKFPKIYLPNIYKNNKKQTIKKDFLFY